MSKTWKPGDVVALRGIYKRRVWYVQSAIVVKDGAQEVALAVVPGAECFAPEGYINGKHGGSGSWNRWQDHATDNWSMQSYTWHTNRLLVLLEPGKYYATIYFWQANNDEFLCYYINFQTPFVRGDYGFDTLDLELDIIIEPSHAWRYKDQEEYQDGIDKGILLKEWTDEIEYAKQEIFEKIELRQYPLDGRWLDWKPNVDWPAPRLPANWSKV